jgi:uncharacterized glyoxalase superfamily protein PhnB
MKNRSVPADLVLPHINYRNLLDASAWLNRVFGFKEAFRYGDPVSGMQMRLGDAYIMIRTARPESLTPAQLGYGTQSVTVFVEDVDGHYATARQSGAEIVEELHETFYGERQYGVIDLDGHHWLFAHHARDVSPEEWGATVGARS